MTSTATTTSWQNSKLFRLPLARNMKVFMVGLSAARLAPIARIGNSTPIQNFARHPLFDRQMVRLINDLAANKVKVVQIQMPARPKLTPALRHTQCRVNIAFDDVRHELLMLPSRPSSHVEVYDRHLNMIRTIPNGVARIGRPEGMCVNSAKGWVYIIDAEHRHLLVFDVLTGEFLRSAVVPCLFTSVALDPQSEEVFAASHGSITVLDHQDRVVRRWVSDLVTSESSLFVDSQARHLYICTWNTQKHEKGRLHRCPLEGTVLQSCCHDQPMADLPPAVEEIRGLMLRAYQWCNSTPCSHWHRIKTQHAAYRCSVAVHEPSHWIAVAKQQFEFQNVVQLKFFM